MSVRCGVQQSSDLSSIMQVSLGVKCRRLGAKRIACQKRPLMQWQRNEKLILIACEIGEEEKVENGKRKMRRRCLSKISAAPAEVESTPATTAFFRESMWR